MQSAERMAQSFPHAENGKAHSADRAITMKRKRPKFRFMDLEIWRDSVEVAASLFEIADRLEVRRLYRFAEQLRGSGLSMSNNIAEGCGSTSKRILQFPQYCSSIDIRKCERDLGLRKKRITDGGRVYETVGYTGSPVSKDHELPEEPTRLAPSRSSA